MKSVVILGVLLLLPAGLGAIIGLALNHVVIGIVVGGIISFLLFAGIFGNNGSNSSSSSSVGSRLQGWAESRMNDPHTCGNCTEYSNTYGKCRRSDSPKSMEDSCNNWR